MNTRSRPTRRPARFNRRPLQVWQDPNVSAFKSIGDKELAGVQELEILGISQDGDWYVVLVDDEPAWVSREHIELPEPALETPEGSGKVGLCANQALTPNGEIAARLQDPSVIADSGVRWVRLNFMQIGERWLERYGEIVDRFRAWGLQIYATLSHDVIGHPGLIMQDTPQGAPDRWPQKYPQQVEWIERYVETCEEVLQTFEGRVGVYETLNEPDLWLEGASWMHPHWFAYTQDRLYRRLGPTYPVKIVQGPLQGTTSGNGAPGYLRSMYELGQRYLHWRQDGSPFDGVAYHIYVWPPNWGGKPEDTQKLYREYLDELWAVITRFEGRRTDKKIYISEFGFPSTIDVNAPKAQEAWQSTMMQAALEFLLADERIALASWFSTEDFDSPGEMFGLYVNAYGARPTDRKRAFYTLRNLAAGRPPESGHGARGFG